jgi:hypothetical protein
LKLYVAKYFTKKMWETISDLNVYVQVAKASVFFRRYTLRKILPKIGTGLILLAASVYRSMIYLHYSILSRYMYFQLILS